MAKLNECREQVPEWKRLGLEYMSVLERCRLAKDFGARELAGDLAIELARLRARVAAAWKRRHEDGDGQHVA